MKLGISFVILLISLNLYAKVTLEQVDSMGLINYQKVSLLDDPYSLLVFNTQGGQVIELYNDKKKVYSRSLSLLTDSFISVFFRVFDDAQAPFAILKLQKGVHGEQLVVINLESGKEVFHDSSVWPLELQISSKAVDYKVFDEKKKAHSKHWAP